MPMENIENKQENKQKQLVIGKHRIIFPKYDIFGLPKNSYRDFLDRLPEIVAGKFPVEVNLDNHLFRIELKNIHVAADFSENNWIDKKAWNSSIKDCEKKRKTLSYHLDADIRVLEDNKVVGTFMSQQLFDFPAMTERASFILGGREMTLKLERSSDGMNAIACGDILGNIIESCDITSGLIQNIRFITEEAKKGNWIGTFNIVDSGFVSLAKEPGTIAVNIQNPLSEASSITTVLFSKDEDNPSPLANKGEYNYLDLLFFSDIAKKEGPKHSETSHYNMFTQVIDGEIKTPVHTIKNGIVTEEISWVGIRDVAGIDKDFKGRDKYKYANGKTVSRYYPIGYKFKGNEPVVKYLFTVDKKTPGSGDYVADKVIGTVKEIGYPDYIPINPFAMTSVNEFINLLTGVLATNPARAAMGIFQTEQGIPVKGLAPQTITTGIEDLVTKATLACLYSKEDGVVESVDEEKIVVRNKGGKTVSYDLEEFLSDATGTDQRYKPIVKAGDNIRSGQVLADGAFTKNGQLCYGVPGIRTVIMPFSRSIETPDGKTVGVSNNNDGFVVSQSLAEKLTHVGVVRTSVDLKASAKGDAVLVRPDIQGRPDERFDEDGLPKIGSVFHYGDVILNQMVPDIKEKDIKRMDMLSDPTNTLGRFSSVERLRKKVDCTVRKVEINDNTVTIVFDYTSPLESGDKLTIGVGTKGVVSRILPDSEMPRIRIGDKWEHAELLVDPMSIVKRGAAQFILNGMISQALEIMGQTAIMGTGVENYPAIAANFRLKAGLSPDGRNDIQKEENPKNVSNSLLPKGSIFVPGTVLSAYGTRNAKTISSMVSIDSPIKTVEIGDRMAGDALSIVMNSPEKVLKDNPDLEEKNLKVETALKAMGYEILKRTGDESGRSL